MIFSKLTPETFSRSFLGGAGNLEVKVATGELERAIAGGQPFPDGLARGAGKVIQVRLALEGDRDFQFGSKTTFAFGAKGGVQGSIDLLWHGEPGVAEILAPYGVLENLSEDALYMMLELVGKAQVNGAFQKTLPSGAGSFGIHLDAGGQLGVRYFLPVPVRNTAKDNLTQFFQGVNLPTALADREVAPGEHALAAGEVLEQRFSGYLKLGVQADVGYTFSRFKAWEIGKQDVTTQAELALGAKLAGSFQVAGDYATIVKNGSAPGWVRLNVLKHSEQSWGLAADISVGLDLETSGIPEQPVAFFEGAIGMDTPTLLKQAYAVLTNENAAQALRERGAAFVSATVAKLLDKAEDAVLTASEVQQAIGMVRRGVDLYNTAGDRFVGFVEGLSDTAVDGLQGHIDRLSEKTHEELKTALEKKGARDVVALLEATAGVDILDIVNNLGVWERVREMLAALKTQSLLDLRAFMKARQAALPVHEMIQELGEAARDPALALDALRVKVQLLAERLTDRALSDLAGSKARKELQKLTKRFADFLKTVHAKFSKVLNDQYVFELGVLYQRADARRALVDIELDLTQAGGKRDYRRAMGGDFEFLSAGPKAHLHIREAVLTHRSSRLNRLSIGAFGQSWSWVKELVLETEERMVSLGNGVLHIYSLEGEVKRSKQAQHESVCHHLLFGLVGDWRQQAKGEPAHLVEHIRTMSFSYDLKVDDKKTKPEELAQYLAFAESLNLLPEAYGGAAEYVRDLQTRLGLDEDEKLGQVSLTYQIALDGAGMMRVFGNNVLSRDQIGDQARAALRAFAKVAWKEDAGFYSKGLVAAAYQEPLVYALWQKQRSLDDGREGSLIWRFGNGAEIRTMYRWQRRALDLFYDAEDDMVDGLTGLDDVIDRVSPGMPIHLPDLEKAHAQVVKAAFKVESVQGFEGLTSPVFAVFDALIARADCRRHAALKLTVLPPGAKEGAEIIQILTA